MNKHISELLSKMTLQEKVGLLHGNGMWKTRGYDRLNIPEIVMTDGTHGVRYNVEQVEGGQSMMIEDFSEVVYTSGDTSETNSIFGMSKPATCFPNGCSLACSFDTQLIEAMGVALGEECQSMGVGILLGPGINIRRTPLAGRGFEYYSEDPVVSGDIAAALITGIQSQGVGTSLKHFACNNSEYQRNTMNSVVEQRALREIYLYGFERTIQKSSPWTVMSSYNRLNGEQTSSSHWLLTEVLREEWGYDGVVLSDWYGVVQKTDSLLAGNDLEMPETPEHVEELLSQAENNPEVVQKIEESCGRILDMVFKIKERENKKATLKGEEHHMLAEKIASESMILLKNKENILPLDTEKIKKLAVIGKGGKKPILQGSGAATTTPAFIDIPLDEIRRLAGEAIEVRYAIGASQKDTIIPEELLEALELAEWADVVVMFVNTPEDENGEDYDAVNINLCNTHEQLIEAVAEKNQELVVVASNGDAIVMPWLDHVKGVLETFFAGQGMGRAAAQILFGEVNPSGRLTVTIPNTLEETPAYLHYPGENGNHIYGEGIYVGYRYYNKRKIKPQFPFGFGLSYTKFEYDNLVLSSQTVKENGDFEVSVQVSNTGERYGKEVVQLYIHDCESRLPRPERELKGFVKAELLPGETKTVQFRLNKRDFSYYDPAYQKWIFESGEFKIQIGSSEEDIRLEKKVDAIAKINYPQKLSLDIDMATALAHPKFKEYIAPLIAKEQGVTIEEVDNLVKEKIGMLTFMNLRSALRNAFHIILSEKEYSDLIDSINKEYF